MSDDRQTLETARAWIAAGHGCAIATVMETWGSAPRRVGAHLVVRDDGLFEGSVSGGCVEGEVIFAARELIAEGGVRRLEYGVADAMAWEVGLACGGRISILVQSIDDAHFPPAMVDAILDAGDAGQAFAVSTDIETGASVADVRGEGAFVRRYDPPLRMMIVGAVHIAQHLAPLAEMLGYRVQIVDPRDGFAAEARFGRAVDPRWPDEAMAEWRPDGGSAVVVLSHDPKIDDPALIAALESPAFYIAALGSRKNHAARLERLAAAGISPEGLARVHGPAGLPIGAASPVEIALSIIAQATERLRKGA